MRIREIEIVGFKSFRDPTRIVLAPGMNAIVGPNGCGKSNVSDAIRWTLGEQSLRHLRARDMEDVIFGGNASGPPLNFAEVTLTFEQADEASLPMAGEDESLASMVARQSEFTVTRRLFRSGESHYLINQQAVRLRDVTELFLGSGVGPKAYAMIEQGRVSALVGAKPEEVRLFIEEAAGTTRFRSRKIAAERKLERTGENLARVRDVMREIERQLGTLRRQAKRAEAFRAFEAELRETELAVSAERWRILASELEDLETARQQAAEELRARQAELGESEGRRETAVESEKHANAEIERAFSALSDASSRVVRGSERQSAARSVLASLEDRVGRARTERNALEDRLSSLRRSVGEAAGLRSSRAERVEIERSALEAAELEYEGLQRDAESLQEAHARAVATLEAARSRGATAAARRAEAATRLGGLREERQRVAERLGVRSQELERAAVRSDEASAAREQAKARHDALADTRKDAAAALQSREDEARRLAEEQASVRESMLHVRGRLDGLREREEAYDGYAEGIAAVMGFESPGPRALLVDALEIPEDLEPAVAAVLGDVLRGAVVASPEDGAGIAERLRRVGEGRVSLVPLDARGPAEEHELPPGLHRLEDLIAAREGFEGLRRALFGEVAVADDLGAAVAAWRSHGNGFTWVTRAGDIVDRRGVVTGGEAPAAAGLLARRRALAELTASLESDQQRHSHIEARLAEVRDECSRLSASLREIDAQAHEATLALVAAEHSVGTARRELASAQAQLESTQSELRAADELVAAAGITAREAENEARASVEAGAEAEARLAEADRAAGERRSGLARAQEARESRRGALARSREDLTVAVSEHAQREHELALAESRGKALEAELDAMGSEREAVAATLAGLEADIEVARREHAEREGDVDRLRRHTRGIQEEVQQIEAQVVALRKAFDAARERGGALEVQIAERRARGEALAAHTRERHGAEVDQLTAPDDFDLDSAVARVDVIKQKIASLGEVNVTAIADAKELEERFAFLDGQRADLEASMEDLRRTIGELSRTSRARFRETFDAANAKFQEIFVELFRGGQACLHLTNPQNLLETGVEIEVQPPGKRVGSLALLSGGERALTAVSLIMSLFSLRATPFCVLDEVDAPLDDANVGRFNAMLRRMSDRTQFIVITHNQRTMETSDALYGVTMPEPGVSQLVSVRLADRRQDRMSLAASA